ncbi:MAG: hypothetical protein OHK0012_08210 [Synechococcales cyanobacterium]
MAQGIDAPSPSVDPSNLFTLVSSTPSPEATLVAVTQPVVLTFDRVLPTALEELQVTVEPETVLGFDLQGAQLILQGEQPWKYSTSYSVTLPSQPSLPLAEAITLTFRTEPQYTFVDNVEPLLKTSCMGCHFAQGRIKAKPLDSYAAVLTYVKPGDPSSTLLLPRWTGRHARILQTRTRLDGTFEVTGRSPEVAFNLRNGLPVNRLGYWTPEEIEIVRTWIVQDQAIEKRD